MIIKDVRTEAAERLKAAGCGTPRLDADLLLAEATGLDRAQLIAGSNDELTDTGRFEQLMERRLNREPVAYILGHKGFRHIDLMVDDRVLVPRPESELVVEVALDLPQGARVVDIGTGSGAIALALKHERPDLEVLMTEISQDAADVASENARRLGLDVECLVGDLLEPVHGRLDAVVANPPYVKDTERLQYEIAWHEPGVALWGGGDGLDIYRRLMPAIAATEAKFFAVEVGQGMAQDVAALVEGFEVELYPDLATNERVVVGRR